MTARKPVIRSPIRRQRSEEYLLLTLLSFAGSVSLTRLFLFATGYPQIGNSELHFAHVLWGGLLLYAAALLPLIFTNAWVFPLSSLLGGVGVGLFIDEVGKFITQTNDYFYPTAAPIIYVFFLLTVLLYVRQRRTRRENLRADLYYILEDLQEVLDHDLSARERADIIAHLERVKRQTIDPDLDRLANAIETFINSQDLYIAEEQKPRWQIWLERLEAVESRWLNRMRYRAVLAGTAAATAVWSLTYPITIYARLNRPFQFEMFLQNLITQGMLRSSASLAWFQVRLSLEFAVGIILLVAAVMIAIGQDRRGFRYAYFGLLFAITVVNVLIFYFDQFSTIIVSIVQFTLLLMLLRYQARFIAKPGQTNL